MSRYWRIYRTFISSSLVRELEFRANFFAKVAQNCVWVFFFVMILFVVYRNTQTVAGWSKGQAFILSATAFLMSAIIGAFFMSLQEVPQQVRLGTLDFVITKPIDTQFWISTRKFNFDQVGTLLAGLIMEWYGVVSSGIHATIWQWLAYGALVFTSICIFYSFYLILMTFGIWLVRVDNLWVLGETVTQIARYPVNIYSVGVQRFLTFVIPLAFIATIPARQLVQGFDGPMLLGGLIWAGLSVLVSRLFWNFALTHYASASS